ncbi:MAG: peptidoglycan bridge formation glycyltransferase FemA/FemB family protein [Candidatus Komeilibacteria bacterium]|nr:peptidoglycan bridge formation glycyltransferase FemA/FemB family protein [Candidatus Komeilibacteria bacterium]
MELKLVSQQELDDFVASQEHAQFLQSWSWGEFQKTLGREVWRFGIEENNEIIASATLIEMPLGWQKSYLYCPRGPIIKNGLLAEQKTEILKLILSKARDLTIQTKQGEEIFFRLEPTFPLPTSQIKLKSTKSIQPPDTLILDLQQSAEQLLADFHPKTRYNIKLAEKHGVKIEKLEAGQFDQCWPLFQQTGERDQFGLHPRGYYQKMLALDEVELWVARNAENAIIAANLMVFYGNTATYLHGASDYNFRQMMAPNLLQWMLINEAKNRGFINYDWHGIAPDDSVNHPWLGVTRFKKGFGGQAISYPGTYDFIYQPGWYQAYQWLRKINLLLK